MPTKKDQKIDGKTNSYKKFTGFLARFTVAPASAGEKPDTLLAIDTNTVGFTLPTWQILSLKTQHAKLPELWVSGSKGLYRRHSWRVSGEAETFIFGDIDSRDRKLLLRFPAGIPVDLHARLFLGRTSPLLHEDKDYPLPGQAEWIDGKKYWHLPAGEQQSVTVREAGETVITSLSASAIGQYNDISYRLSSGWNEQNHSTRIFQGGNTVVPDIFDCPQPAPKLNRLRLTTPEPGATLHFSADQDLLIRISTLTRGRYLFDINQPVHRDLAPKRPSRARHSLDLLRPGLHDWSEREQALYQQSLELISNTYRDGALAAIELLDNQLEISPSDPIQALRNTLWSRVTSYRDLRPENLSSSLRLRFASINLPARDIPEASANFYPLRDVGSYPLTTGRHRKHFRLALAPLEATSAIKTDERFARLQAHTERGEQLEFMFDLANETISPLPPGRAVMEDGVFRAAASSTEFTLPGNSGMLSIRQLSGPPLAIALQVRHGLPFRLSEPELMSLLTDHPEAPYQLLLSAIKSPAAIYRGSSDHLRTRLLKSHLRPMLLKLEQQRAKLIDGLDSYQPRLKKIGDTKSLQVLNTLSRQQNWDRLVYASHPLSSSQDTHIRRSAMAARHLALSKLGEHRTAEHFLKLGLFDPDKDIRSWAEKTLAQRYQSNHQTGRLSGLYTQLIRNGDTRYFDSLVHNLSAVGREHDALTLALVLPDFDPEHTAHLALAQHWHRAFEHTLTRLPPIRQKHWLARRALQFGDFDLASEHWRDAAKPRLAARAKLGAGQLVLLFSSGNPEDRSQWLRWLSSFDRARTNTRRRTVPDGLIAGRTADVIDNATANRTGYYQLEPGLPLTLTIQGPVELDLTARGVFDDPGDLDYSAWLDIRHNAETIYFPLRKLSADNASNELGQTVSLPTSTTIHLDSGRHRLRFHSSKAQLIRLQMEQPALLSGPLPETQTATLWGGVEPVKANIPRHHWLDRYRQRPACHPQYQGQGYSLKHLFEPEQRFAIAHTAVQEAPLQGFAAAQTGERAQALLSSQTLGELASNPKKLTPQQAYSMALSALWYRDNDILDPALAAGYIAIARRFGGDNHRVAAIYGDIAAQYRWQLIDNIRTSAGIRKFDQSGPVPGSSISRELFLKNAPSHLTRLVDPDEKLVFNYDTLDGAQLRLGMEQLVLPGELRDEVEVLLSVNGNTSKSIRLPGNGRKRAFTLDLNPGSHQITFAVRGNDPKARIALSVAEREGEDFKALDNSEQRAYFVADPSTPVQIDTLAPAFYRIDRRDNERLSSTYQAVLARGNPIILGTGSEPAAYFRVYQFTEKPDPGAPVYAGPGTTSEQIQTLPYSPHLALNWLGDVDGYILSSYDEPALGSGSNRGTWALSTRVGESRQSDEDRGGGITPLYTQMALSYRRHFDTIDLYSRTEFLHRDYADELDSMSGIRQWLDWYPENSNWHLGGYGHYYRQDVRERRGKSSNDALFLRAEADHSVSIGKALTHRVRLQAFQHWISLKENDLAPGAAADPNIYSSYKDDHPSGWNITDRLTLDYWRDNRVYIEGELRSNSLWDPADLDAYGLRIGVDQLYGEFTFGGNFHYRWYKNDGDRTADSAARRLNFYVDWNRWRNSHGLQLGSDVSFDFDTGINAWNLHLNWYFNSGKLEHFRRGELKFRSLQSRLLESETNISPVWYK